MLEVALDYHDKGYAVVPAILENLANGKVNKRPIVTSWKQYQTQKPSRSLVEFWFKEKHPTAHIGAFCGAEHGIFVVDLDKGWKPADLLLLNLNKETRTIRTPSGGYHYYYKHPGIGTHVLTSSDKDKHIDVRGDGGFIVIPPSAYPDGRQYVVEKDVPIAEASKQTLAFVTAKKASGKNIAWNDRMDGGGVGGRTASAISIAGALLAYQPPSQWRTLVWEIVRMWNERNDPPLDELKLSRDFKGIMAREADKRSKRT